LKKSGRGKARNVGLGINEEIEKGEISGVIKERFFL
jgi:hypothetical protein